MKTLENNNTLIDDESLLSLCQYCLGKDPFLEIPLTKFKDKELRKKIVNYLNVKIKDVYKNTDDPFESIIRENDLFEDDGYILIYHSPEPHMEVFIDNSTYRFYGLLIIKDDRATFTDDV